MKNHYNVFLLYLCVMIIAMICAVQVDSLLKYDSVWDLNGSDSVFYHIRARQAATLILAVVASAILVSKEEINRGMKRKAYTDVTGIMNKHACMERMHMLDCGDSTLGVGLVMFDLNNLKKVNDFLGHEEGDRLIQNFVQILRQASNKKCFLGRFGGDEFVAILEHCTEETMEIYLQQIHKLAEKFNKSSKVRISYACGGMISTREHYYLMDDLLKEADKKMYENKKRVKSEELLQKEPVETRHGSRIVQAERTREPKGRVPMMLYGYDAFVVAVENVLRVSGKEDRFAIVYSDIYNFGYFNDLFGHKEGNLILERFASELSGQPFCRCVYRMYSDNFAFLMDLSCLSQQEGTELIQEWNTHFSQLINSLYKGSRLIVKSGIYFISDTAEPVEIMLNNVNYAHKSAKASLQNIFVYCEGLSLAAKRRAKIVSTFQNALEQGEFKVYVQPQVSCGDKNICAAEALIRWKKQNGSLFYPDEFIPVLEQTGDIVDLDFYVYEKVFSYLYANELAGKKQIPLSVNLSRIHLLNVDRFVDRLQALWGRYPVSPSLIMFEVTETAYIQEIDSAHLFIQKLHQLGYRISMDDFGSGYSSLKALQSMPFDEIKFDGAFLRGKAGKRETDILLQIICLIKKFGIPIVCEGAETVEHIELLEQSMCDVIQGYYYYKPFPLEELESRQMQVLNAKQENPLLFLCVERQAGQRIQSKAQT